MKKAFDNPKYIGVLIELRFHKGFLNKFYIISEK